MLRGERVVQMQMTKMIPYKMEDFQMLPKVHTTYELYSTEWVSLTKRSLLFQALMQLACATETEADLLDHGLRLLLTSITFTL